jgi:hypothetical protein
MPALAGLAQRIEGASSGTRPRQGVEARVYPPLASHRQPVLFYPQLASHRQPVLFWPRLASHWRSRPFYLPRPRSSPCASAGHHPPMRDPLALVDPVK